MGFSITVTKQVFPAEAQVEPNDTTALTAIDGVRARLASRYATQQRRRVGTVATKALVTGTPSTRQHAERYGTQPDGDLW